MGRREEYRAELRALTTDWAPYLAQRSGLPGARANLELVGAVAEEAGPAQLEALIATDEEYLVMCGVVGLGRLLVDDPGPAKRLRKYATDERWRVREAVAMALQRLGDSDLQRMLDLATDWANDPDPLVLRAAVAGVCEPRLLKTPAAAATAIHVCQQATKALADNRDRTLRKALGYCWSVAVAALPEEGLPRFEALEHSADPDIQWVVRENGKKARLTRLR
jgi:hypothetical protein